MIERDKQFIEIYNVCSSSAEVAEILRTTKAAVKYRAKKLRKLGVKLKPFRGYASGKKREVDPMIQNNYKPKKCTSPSCYAPGTVAKIEELAKRVERGEDLWHDRDATFASGQGCLRL